MTEKIVVANVRLTESQLTRVIQSVKSGCVERTENASLLNTLERARAELHPGRRAFVVQ